MWALIMTVCLGIPASTQSQATLTVCAVSTFETEILCRRAGAQQEVILRNDFKIDTGKKYSFVCVKLKD